MKKELIVDKEPKSPISEIFRTLRTNIQFMNIKRKAKTLLVTSTYMGEGKSWVASNLAVTFAQTGKKVILIDGDMRKGRQYSIFKASPKPGLSDYLSQIDDEENVLKYIGKYLQETDIDNLYLISAGSIPPNPSELLVSEQMIKLIDKLKQLWDIVIIDGTPCELVTDSIILSGIVDSTVVVTAYNSTKKDALRRTIKNIQNVEGKIAGVIINKIPISSKKYGENYYYYGNDEKDSRRERTEQFRKVDVGKIENINKEKIKKVIDVNNQDKIIDREKINSNNINRKNEVLTTRNDLLENNETIKKMKQFITEESKTIEDKEPIKQKKIIAEENITIENKEPIKRKKKIITEENITTEDKELVRRKKKITTDESKRIEDKEPIKRRKRAITDESKEIENSEPIKRRKKVVTGEEKIIESNKELIKKKKIKSNAEKIIQNDETTETNKGDIDSNTILDDKILNISKIKKINKISEENNVLDINDILKISS